MLQEFGSALALMNGVKSFAGWEVQAAEERIPRILQTGRIDLDLLTDRSVS